MVCMMGGKRAESGFQLAYTAKQGKARQGKPNDTKARPGKTKQSKANRPDAAHVGGSSGGSGCLSLLLRVRGDQHDVTTELRHLSQRVTVMVWESNEYGVRE
jgi:hypothetical protein